MKLSNVRLGVTAFVLALVGVGLDSANAQVGGACCRTVDNECIVRSEAVCAAVGTYLGDGTMCADDSCEDCNDNGVADSLDLQPPQTTVSHIIDSPDTTLPNPGTACSMQNCPLGQTCIDSDNNGMLDTCGFSHTFFVPQHGMITDIDVDATIVATFYGNVRLLITHEATGTTVVLLDGAPEDNSNLRGNYIFDDEALVSLDSAATLGTCLDGCNIPVSPPSYKPDGALSAFDGLERRGNWTISIVDDLTGNTVEIRAWSLRITVAPGEPTSTDCNENGILDECEDPDPTTVGACCDGGECSRTTRTACMDVGGMYMGDCTTCDDFMCPQPGYCCGPLGACRPDADETACGAAGGIFHANQMCGSLEACCVDDDGHCLNLTAQCCQDIGGETLGAGTACSRPEIMCPLGAVVECGQPTDPSATGSATAMDDCTEPPTISHSDVSRRGMCPRRQVITRTWTATDADGNMAMCNQTIVVVDTTAPEITCPETIVVRCTSPEGIAVGDVEINVTAADLCDQDLTVDDNRPDGFYPPSCLNGQPTIVTFTATDDCDLMDTCEVPVFVYGPMCCPGFVDEELTLLPADVDLRQETNGPTITKGNFDIWNQDEVRFSGTHRCVNCWDQTLLSEYASPNHFLRGMIHTDKGKARVDGLQSDVCPDSVESPMVGVFTKEITFPGRITDILRSAITPVGTGSESAQIRYDIIAPQNALAENAETSKRQNVETSEPIGNRQSAIGNSGTVAGINPGGRGDITRKGSLLMWPRVEIRWNAERELIEDTFLTLSNDDPLPVDVQLYLVNGDPPLEPECDPACQANFGGVCEAGPCLTERAHPGWNKSDVQLTLTANQPTYWSAATGQPAGVSSFDILDPAGILAIGRPDLDPRNPGGRVIRGFVMGWAVNPEGHEICWNHLTGSALLIHYEDSSAAEYNAWAFQCVAGVDQGSEPDGFPGQLNLDGVEYENVPDALIFDFYSVGSTALTHPDVLRRRVNMLDPN